jgi:hypothetical protein
MRRAAVTVTLIGFLAACFSASLRRSPQDRSIAPASAQSSQNEETPIDQSKVVPLTARRAPKQLGETAMQHVRALVAFGPRHTAPKPQPGWSKQIDYIEQELKRHGIEPVRDTWTDRKELLTFSNISATLPGKRPERIVLACHHDTKCTTGHADPEHNFAFVGANDGASGVAMLLALAPVLKQQANEATLELVFFDGEESLDWDWNQAARALFGSKRYVERHRDAELQGKAAPIAAMVLLDMVGRTDLHIQEELYSTPRLRTLLWSAAKTCGYEREFFRVAESASDDHRPFLDVGIPAVDLIDLNGNPHWHKPTDTVENMSAASLHKVADVVLTMLPAIEQDYVLQKR